MKHVAHWPLSPFRTGVSRLPLFTPLRKKTSEARRRACDFCSAPSLDLFENFFLGEGIVEFSGGSPGGTLSPYLFSPHYRPVYLTKGPPLRRSPSHIDSPFPLSFFFSASLFGFLRTSSPRGGRDRRRLSTFDDFLILFLSFASDMLYFRSSASCLFLDFFFLPRCLTWLGLCHYFSARDVRGRGSRARFQRASRFPPRRSPFRSSRFSHVGPR